MRGSKPQRVPRLSTVLGPQLADDLAGSELFGNRKFAFTGANDDHPGIFGDVAVDDVLLDEIADLSPSPAECFDAGVSRHPPPRRNATEEACLQSG